MQRLRIKRSSRGRLLSAILDHLPGAWIQPSTNDLVSLYRMRYRMALEEKKYDIALIFLNKILEVDPMNLDAKFAKGEIYHIHLRDYPRAVEQYSRIVRITATAAQEAAHVKARTALSELMEMLS